jgi:hypothetical protein
MVVAPARAGGGQPSCPLEPWTATSPPVLSGFAAVGGTLLTSNGVWPRATSGTTYQFAWFRDGVAISGATLSSYVVTTTDVGRALYAQVTATNTCIRSGSATSDAIEVGDQMGTPSAAITDDTNAKYLLGEDGAYHRVLDNDTAFQKGLYWCNAESDWCGVRHYATASALPSPAGSDFASCNCEFWVELPTGVVYQYDDSDGGYHRIPDSSTAAALGLSQCGTDWCLVHHDAALPASEGAALPSITDLNATNSLGVSQGSNKGERVDQIRRFTSVANGARARWVVRSITAPLYNLVAGGDHANHTLWVGANGRDPQRTWVEVGVLAGSQNADLLNHWTYYTARGINCSGGFCGSYAAINFTEMGQPALGTTHMFSAYYNGSTTFRVNIDGANHYSWPSVRGPTIEYDVGFEAICASSCQGAGTDTVSRTFVSRLQSRRARDGAWITSDHGNLHSFGATSGSGIQWCAQYFSFRDWLNYSGDTSSCL